ncbi:MAG: peptidylprolyl isomerase [Candidatus Binatia bacterium]|nr:peptidylprolyl isomerase [Candidatus Binatia bacterium]
MLERTTLCVGVVLGLILAGCDGKPPPVPETNSAKPTSTTVAQATVAGEVAARYGDDVMTVDELTVELQRLPARSRGLMDEDGRARFVENYVLHQLLFDEGIRRGFDQDPDIRQQVEDMNRRLVVQKLVKDLQSVPPITEEQILAYYDENQARYSTTTLRARHILVREEELAEELREKLETEPESFEDLAKEHSVDTASARKGGDLGFFGHGRMVPEFEAAAFSLKEPGNLSDVVKTQYGHHIIKLEERRDGKGKPLDQVREQIRTSLRHSAVQTRTQEYYEELKKTADIRIDSEVVERVALELPVPSPATGVNPLRGGGH